MATNYHHGVTVRETTDLSTIINDIDSAVIGVVCTADDADADIRPCLDLLCASLSLSDKNPLL